MTDQTSKNKGSLSNFYKRYYYYLGKMLKWPLYLLLFATLAISSVILLTDQLTDSGFGLYAIETESMVNTLDPGDLVAVRAESEYQNDDIVSFKYNPEDKKPITHRIISKEKSEKTLYTTKGDNNPSPDPYSISDTQIIGKVINTFPGLGKPVLFIRSVEGIILFLIIPVTILLTLNVQSVYRWLEDH